jgi:hypothetical protein
VVKSPSVGAKSVSFAEAGPDYQRLSEQIQSSVPPVGAKSVKNMAVWHESCVGANSVTPSLLTFASEINIHKQRLWQIMQ